MACSGPLDLFLLFNVKNVIRATAKTSRLLQSEMSEIVLKARCSHENYGAHFEIQN